MRISDWSSDVCSSDLRRIRTRPTEHTRNPNLSTENQPEGAARRPSDTLDREPRRDPQSGGAIPSNYDPRTMTRRGEEGDSRAGQLDRKSTRLNSSHSCDSRMPSSAWTHNTNIQAI